MNPLQVGSVASSDTGLLGGGVDGNEDEAGVSRVHVKEVMNLLGLLDGLVDIGGEEQVPASGLFDDLVKSRLVDGQVVAVPSVDTGLVQVDNGDLDLGAAR